MSMIKNSVLTVKSETENMAVELGTVKNFLKIDFDDDDALLQKLVRTAVSQCETNIGKSLTEKVYVYSAYEIRANSLVLPYAPIKSVEKIELVVVDNGVVVLEGDGYFLDTVGGILNFKNRPSNFYRIDIEYRAGMGTINDDLVQAILMHVARMYEDRSGYSPVPLNSLNIYKKYRQVRV